MMSISWRRKRWLKTTSRRWQRQAIFLLGGVVVGAAAVALAKLADQAQLAFNLLLATSRYASLVVTPLGFALSVFLTNRFFANAQGSGIPQAIAARHLSDPRARSPLVSIRVAIGKILLTLLGLLCGGSVGREGPTVQVGASIMFALGRLSPRRQPGLILAGAAAGVAAAFNTPLAGIVFAIEEMGRAYEARTNGLVLTAVILAGLASLGLLGNYTYFGVAKDTVAFAADWPLVLACGIIGGGVGALFSLSALKVMRRIRRWNALQPLPRALAVAAVCGLAVAIIGVASGGLTFGTGYVQARGAIEGTPLPAFFFVEKFAAGLLSMVSGIPGGLFAPSLAVGAGLGSTLGLVFGTATGTAALLGMAGYFAGVVQAPMTAFVIILEMTGNHDNVIALMCAAMLGYGTARLISNEPLYHALSRVFIAEAIRRRRAETSEAVKA